MEENIQDVTMQDVIDEKKDYWHQCNMQMFSSVLISKQFKIILKLMQSI